MKEVVRIIIIEDNPADAELAEYTLKSAGFNLVSKIVKTRGEFLSALSDFSPDLILSDYDLPAFNGADALDIVRELRPEIPFILFTGAMGEERAIEILTSGATDYVMKNRLSRLVPAAERALKESEGQKRRKAAEAERDLLLQHLEARVQERTAQLQAEVAERKQMEEALREGNQLIQSQLAEIESYYDNAPVALCVLDNRMRYVRVNERLARMNGMPVSDHINRTPREVIPRLADRIESAVQKVIKSDEPVRNEEFIAVVEGVERTWIASYFPIKDKSNQIAYINITVEEITERRQAEEALRASEQKFRAAFMTGLDAVYVATLKEGRIVEINDQFEAVFGYEREEVIGRTSIELGLYENPSVRPQIVSELVEKGWIRNFETRGRKKNGEIFTGSLSISMLQLDGRPYILGVIRDITDRKRAEEALRKSEEEYRLLVENAPTGIYEFDFRGPRFKSVNDAMCLILGYSREELLEINPLEILDEESRGRLQERINRVLAGQPVEESVSYGVLTRDARKIWVELEIKLKDRTSALVVARDVTERKRAEEALRRFEVIAENSRDIVLFMRRDDGRLLEVNAAAENAYGYSRKELLLLSIHDLRATETQALAIGQMAEADVHGILFETIHRRKDGSTFSVEVSSQGATVGGVRMLISVVRDITERRKAEEALRESEERFRSAFDRGAIPMTIAAPGGSLMMVNAAFGQMVGYAEAELSYMSFYDLTHPDDIPANKIGVDAITRGEKDSFRMEKRYIRKNGEVIWADMSTASVRDAGGKLLYIVTHAQDITDRKRMADSLREARDRLEVKVRERTHDLMETNKALQAEIDSRRHATEELQRAEDAYRKLVEVNPVGILRTVYDPVTRHTERLECNEAHLRLLGYASLQEWLAESTPIVFYSQSEFENYMDILLKYGKATNHKIRMKRKDGMVIWVLLNVTARKFEDKFLIEGTMTDITSEKRIEDRLLSAQKKLRAMASEIVLADERSRQHFATDLHDTVVQTLGAAKLRAEIIRDEITREAQPSFMELQDLLSQSITQARSIMTEMSPPVLYELGFVPALEWLTEQIERRHGITIDFRVSCDEPLTHEIQVLLFQAVRELLMNTVKHAKADRASVKVSGNKHRIRIEVIDNGIGFDKYKAFRPDSHSGYGLFSIRERLRHMGGKFNIQSPPGKGTHVTITAPRTMEKSH